MSRREPVTELDRPYSSQDATPTPWADAVAVLQAAQIFWVSTVRADGRPHATPLIAVWIDDSIYFCTGSGEQKARNIEIHPDCLLTTGCNTYAEGLDLVLEGPAVRVTDDDVLRGVARAYEQKYGAEWHFDVRDATFVGSDGNHALVFEVVPTKVYGYGRGTTFSATRWTFDPA